MLSTFFVCEENPYYQAVAALTPGFLVFEWGTLGKDSYGKNSHNNVKVLSFLHCCKSLLVEILLKYFGRENWLGRGSFREGMRWA